MSFAKALAGRGCVGHSFRDARYDTGCSMWNIRATLLQPAVAPDGDGEEEAEDAGKQEPAEPEDRGFGHVEAEEFGQATGEDGVEIGGHTGVEDKRRADEDGADDDAECQAVCGPVELLGETLECMQMVLQLELQFSGDEFSCEGAYVVGQAPERLRKTPKPGHGIVAESHRRKSCGDERRGKRFGDRGEIKFRIEFASEHDHGAE